MTPIKTALAGAALLLSSTAASATTIEITNGELLDENETIVENAAKVETFSTLVAAVQAAGLADALMGEGPFTVFAPLDSAFAELPEGTVESLLMEENREQLVTLLSAHVVPAKVTGRELQIAFASTGDVVFSEDGGEVMSEEDGRVRLSTLTLVSDLAIDKRGDAFYIEAINGTGEEAEIVGTDIMASNGVIHVIDTVLTPNQ
ncbi:MAG: fasciclin domain-containing protein [Pseudomonadota bacterium]